MHRRLVPGATAAPMTKAFKRADQLRQQEATLRRYLIELLVSSLGSLQSFPGLRRLLNISTAAPPPLGRTLPSGRRLRAVGKAAGGKAQGGKASKEAQAHVPLDLECLATLYTPVPEQPTPSDEPAPSGKLGGKATAGRGAGKTVAGKGFAHVLGGKTVLRERRSGKARSLFSSLKMSAG